MLLISNLSVRSLSTYVHYLTHFSSSWPFKLSEVRCIKDRTYSLWVYPQLLAGPDLPVVCRGAEEMAKYSGASTHALVSQCGLAVRC